VKENMKGISAVIAVLLLLVITLGLVGLAYGYISGVFTAKTAVVLSIEDAECTVSDITVWVTNDGTTTSGSVDVNVTDDGSCSITSIAGGGTESCSTGAGAGAGYHTVKARTSGSTASGQVYCAA
jgi:flagellin-like protein